MAWNRVQAANDLERYLLRGEKPAIGAVKLAVSELRNAERTCSIHETDHEYEDSIRCSACRMTFNRPWEPFKYCPNCGAKVVD